MRVFKIRIWRGKKGYVRAWCVGLTPPGQEHWENKRHEKRLAHPTCPLTLSLHRHRWGVQHGALYRCVHQDVFYRKFDEFLVVSKCEHPTVPPPNTDLSFNRSCVTLNISVHDMKGKQVTWAPWVLPVRRVHRWTDVLEEWQQMKWGHANIHMNMYVHNSSSVTSQGRGWEIELGSIFMEFKV